MKVNAIELRPRRLRPLPPPLALYLRAGRNDHKSLLQVLSEGRTAMSGVVLSGALTHRHGELLEDIHERGLEAVLDPHSLELATPSGFARPAMQSLPWAGESMHTPEHLRGKGGSALAESVASFAAGQPFSAVLAPTHFLEGPSDPWLRVDAALTKRLRRRLDEAGRRDVLIYYPLALPGTVLRKETALQAVLGVLHDVPIDALWLRIHPFGLATSGPRALSGYIRACRILHSTGWPIVAERSGTVGLPLMAFGAVGGIESGVTYGERFDVTPLMRPASSATPFSPSPRVYLSTLGLFLSREKARRLFDVRGMRTMFGCRDSSCCRLGYKSMISDPKRHFLLERMREVAWLSGIPERMREMQYLEDVLRPATDVALRAARTDAFLEPVRMRLESWRQTLGALHSEEPAHTYSPVPQRNRLGRRYAV